MDEKQLKRRLWFLEELKKFFRVYHGPLPRAPRQRRLIRCQECGLPHLTRGRSTKYCRPCRKIVNSKRSAQWRRDHA